MPRDHSIDCDHCGRWYGGMNGPDECDCYAATTERTKRIAADAIADPFAIRMSPANHAAYVEAFKPAPRTDSSRIYPGPQCEHTERIAALEVLVEFYSSSEQKHRDDTFASIARLDAVERRIAELEATALAVQSVGLIRDRRTDNRRTASDVPKPSRRGKGRRK